MRISNFTSRFGPSFSNSTSKNRWFRSSNSSHNSLSLQQVIASTVSLCSFSRIKYTISSKCNSNSSNSSSSSISISNISNSNRSSICCSQSYSCQWANHLVRRCVIQVLSTKVCTWERKSGNSRKSSGYSSSRENSHSRKLRIVLFARILAWTARGAASDQSGVRCASMTKLWTTVT